MAQPNSTHRIPPVMATMSEACEALRIGRTKLYEEMSAGRINSVKAGRLRLIPVQELQAWPQRLKPTP